MKKIFTRHLSSKFMNVEVIVDNVWKHRNWLETDLGRKLKHNQDPENFEFSLMTYNILSQDLISNFKELYYHCSSSSLNWTHRGERICKELKEANPDIICLQEVNFKHYHQYYKPFLTNQGYSGLYKKKTGLRKDGCALYYKTNKFTLSKSVELEFYRKDLNYLLNRDNVAIIGVLSPKRFKNKKPYSKLILATTHLLFNPNRGDIKLAQLRLLLAELDRVVSLYAKANQDSQLSVILCGDMNTQPNSPLYKFITDGYINPLGHRCGDLAGQLEGIGNGYIIRESDLKLNGIDCKSKYILKSQREPSENKKSIQNEQDVNSENQICHSFNFASVYPSHDSNGLSYVTTHHRFASCVVDYIFYTKSNSLKLLGYRELFNSAQMKEIRSLPNECFGSDHFSLFAKFLL